MLYDLRPTVVNFFIRFFFHCYFFLFFYINNFQISGDLTITIQTYQDARKIITFKWKDEKNEEFEKNLLNFDFYFVEIKKI